MTSKSESIEAAWADLKDKLEQASTGLGKNKRSWIYRRTPNYFESQNAKIELTAWLRCLFESSHIILKLDEFLELNNRIWSLFSDQSIEKCNVDQVENRLESSGPMGESLLRAMSDSMKNCQDKVIKNDRPKSTNFDVANLYDKNDVEKSKNDQDNKSNDNESKDTNGLKYFDLIVGYLKSHFDEIKDQYSKTASKHYLDQSVHFFDHKNGKRAMEDRICIIEDLGIYCESDLVKEQIMFCIFDGHRGSECSDFLKTYAPFMWSDVLESTNDKNKAIIELFENLDQIFLAKAEFEGISAGAVGVISIIDSNNHLFTGWIGDCEAHLIATNGEVKKLVKPHKLSDPSDRELIEQKGGKIVDSGSASDGKNILRLNGQLAVGRSIGDIFHKPYMISEASASEWVDLNRNDFQYLILVCDGVMDVMEPEELPKILKSAQKPIDHFNLAEYIIEEARTRKSDDNLTAIVVDIPRLLQLKGK